MYASEGDSATASAAAWAYLLLLPTTKFSKLYLGLKIFWLSKERFGIGFNIGRSSSGVSSSGAKADYSGVISSVVKFASDSIGNSAKMLSAIGSIIPF